MATISSGTCAGCGNSDDVVDVGCACEACVKSALELFEEHAIVLPDWAILRIVNGTGYQMRVPVTEQTTAIDGHPNIRFEDVDLNSATVADYLQEAAGLDCQCGCERAMLRPAWWKKKRFWVAEAFKVHPVGCESDQEYHECDEYCRQTHVYYRATPRVGYRPVPDKAEMTYLHESTPLTDFHRSGFRNARRMRRQWSRINLGIELNRVERIQDISDEEIQVCVFPCDHGRDPGVGRTHSREKFIDTWNNSFAHEHRYGVNPWTWVVETVPTVCGRHVPMKKENNQ